MGTSKNTALRTALLVATALGLSAPAALAQEAGQSGSSGERFGQMKTPEGHEQAGDTGSTRMSGRDERGSTWQGRDQDSTASVDDDDDEDDDAGDGYRQSASHHDDRGGDRSRGDRWRSGSRDDERDFWRQHMRQEWRNRMQDRMQARGMDMQPRGMMGMMGASRGAVFNVQVGDARVTVRCAPREEMSACVDAAVSLVNRLRQGTSGSSTSGSSSPAPSTGPSSANPAPAPSTSKPTTP